MLRLRLEEERLAEEEAARVARDEERQRRLEAGEELDEEGMFRYLTVLEN